MGYGYEVHGRGDRLLNAAKTRIKFAASRVLPGALLVNQIPLRMSLGTPFTLAGIIDLPHTLQCVTSLTGYHGLATSHWHVLVASWEMKPFILRFDS